MYKISFSFSFSFLFPFFFSFSFLPSLSRCSLSLFPPQIRAPSLSPLILFFFKILKTSIVHIFLIRRPFDACLVPLESSRREEQFERWFVAGNCRDSPENWPESSVFVGFAGIPISELFLEKRAPSSCSGGSKL